MHDESQCPPSLCKTSLSLLGNEDWVEAQFKGYVYTTLTVPQVLS